MPIRYNVDTDSDYILLQHQGALIPTPTRIAVDDGETISGGVQPGGGSTSAAGGSAVAGTAAQQNFSQIQENPLPCVAHGTQIACLSPLNGNHLMWIESQMIMRGDRLWFPSGPRKVITPPDRVWCESLWLIVTNNGHLRCSPDHRVITSHDDIQGTPVSELQAGSPILGFTDNAIAPTTVISSQSLATAWDIEKAEGWVYRITLETTDDPTCHWFVSDNVVSHNVKPQDDQR